MRPFESSVGVLLIQGHDMQCTKVCFQSRMPGAALLLPVVQTHLGADDDRLTGAQPYNGCIQRYHATFQQQPQGPEPGSHQETVGSIF